MRIALKTAVALTTVLGLSPLAHADPVNWTLNANGSWGVNGNWDAVPAWDGSDDIRLTYTDTNGISGNKTLTLDGDRVINSIYGADLRTPVNTAQVGMLYTVNSGSPAGSTLTLLSGNITVDNSGKTSGSAWAFPLSLAGITTQVGDGITPVTNAEWQINNSLTLADPTTHGQSRQTRLRVGEYTGIVGTQVYITGTTVAAYNALELVSDSSNFFGTLTNQSKLWVIAGASNALGAGVIEHTTDGFFSIEASGLSNSQIAEIRLLDGKTNLQNSTTNGVLTLNGNLTGAGEVEFNRAGFGSVTRRDSATIIVNGAANTLSGNINNSAGILRIDGVWTGAGNVTISRGSLQGVGALGLASDKNLTVSSDNASFNAAIDPGTAGTVGTLTVGTNNSNTVAFNINSFLNIDIDGAVADLLVINGNLNLTNESNTIVFNELSSPSAGFYTLVTYTGTLTGEFSTVIGLPDGYELDYSTVGQINLIPEPGSLALMGLGGLLMLMRRRD